MSLKAAWKALWGNNPEKNIEDVLNIKKDENPDLPVDEIEEKNSDRPWVKIVGEEVDPKNGIKIELDWNPPFIEYLKKNGITGTDDEQVIQKWLAMLYKDMMDNMVNEQLDKDFE